jgi:hypothetical protein
MLFTNFPYLADEEDFEKFRKAGIILTIGEIPEHLDFADLPQRSGREDETHRALKKLGGKMLRDLGALDVKFENNFIDVSSKSLQIAIECGDRPISRVWSMLFNDFCSHWIKEVWCIYVNESTKIEHVRFVKPQSIIDYEKKIGWRETTSE